MEDIYRSRWQLGFHGFLSWIIAERYLRNVAREFEKFKLERKIERGS